MNISRQLKDICKNKLSIDHIIRKLSKKKFLIKFEIGQNKIWHSVTYSDDVKEEDFIKQYIQSSKTYIRMYGHPNYLKSKNFSQSYECDKNGIRKKDSDGKWIIVPAKSSYKIEALSKKELKEFNLSNETPENKSIDKKFRHLQ